MLRKLRTIIILCALLLLGTPLPAAEQAQPGTDIPIPRATDCPPGVANGPKLGTDGSDRNLSEQLAQSRGVICPPAGIDPGLIEPAPGGGRTPVIPPPGSPGGDPAVRPK
jgi:hypothetical protein